MERNAKQKAQQLQKRKEEKRIKNPIFFTLHGVGANFFSFSAVVNFLHSINH